MKPGLLPVRDTALGLCSMSESSLSVCLWRPDNPWWRGAVLIVVSSLHLPSNTYEDLLNERAEQQGPALTWHSHDGNRRKGPRRRWVGGRRSWGRQELTPSCEGQSVWTEQSIYLAFRKNKLSPGCFYFSSGKRTENRSKRRKCQRKIWKQRTFNHSEWMWCWLEWVLPQNWKDMYLSDENFPSSYLVLNLWSTLLED